MFARPRPVWSDVSGCTGIRDVGSNEDASGRYGQAKRRMGSIPVSGAISRTFLR